MIKGKMYFTVIILIKKKEKIIRNFKKVLAILVLNTYSIQTGAVRFDSVPQLGHFFGSYLLRMVFFAL